MATILPPPEKLKFDSSRTTANSWRRFKQAWRNYELASGLKDKDNEIRVATFLHIAGEEAQEKYESFLWENENLKKDMEEVIKKFDQDCAERTNVIAERFKFLRRKQGDSETCDQFATALRTLVLSCEYEKPEEALRDQFVLNVHHEKAREKLLDAAQKNAKELTFQKAINLVKNFEATRAQSSQMATSKEFTMKVTDNQLQGKNSKQCPKCTYSHAPNKCPAYGKKCNKCFKLNHFARACRGRKVNVLSEPVESDGERQDDSELQEDL